MKISILRVNPIDPVSSLLLPFLTQRMLEYSKVLVPELDPQEGIKQILSKLCLGDPTVALLAVVDGDSGEVVGHCLATLLLNESVAYLLQIRADGNVGDALRQCIDWLDKWMLTYGITTMVMVSTKAEKSWEKPLGFVTTRRQLHRKIAVPKQKPLDEGGNEAPTG